MHYLQSKYIFNSETFYTTPRNTFQVELIRLNSILFLVLAGTISMITTQKQ